MAFSIRAFLGIGVASWIVAGLLAGMIAGRAEGLSIESVGARGGFAADHLGQGLHQAEAFANWTMPWGWELGREWHLQSRLDFSLGWFGGRGDNAVLGTVGPSVVLSRARLPLSLEGGVSPTFLSRDRFGDEDFGLRFQFTLHVGLNWDFAPHWRVGYRYQHMSNADFVSHNPGLNMHIFALSYCF